MGELVGSITEMDESATSSALQNGVTPSLHSECVGSVTTLGAEKKSTGATELVEMGGLPSLMLMKNGDRR
jgi:hypothetical protein